MDVLWLVASFAVILAGALLFTNAVEWAGHRLGLAEGATGSVLAAVGTAMPETLIPIVAVIGGEAGSDEVAIGAIIGAPFLLATIAMALVGISALLFLSRRPQGTTLEADVGTLDRDLRFFMIFFAIGLLAGVGLPLAVRVAVALACVVAYVAYVNRTLGGQGDVEGTDAIGPLWMDSSRGLSPKSSTIALQVVVGLGAIVGGAHLFVEELITVADDLGIEPLVLSLVLAPLATELPEKANSFLWVRDGKDTLALGNITGAMVFQSTIPVAFGLTFTDWDLDSFAVVSGCLGLAGGLIAYWALRLRDRFEPLAIVVWSALFVAYVVYVAVS